MHIVSLYRYPVKGLSPERLKQVSVRTADGFPLDRKFALLRSTTDFDPSSPVWLAKANFLMLMLHEKLASLKSRYDDSNNTLYIQSVEFGEKAFSLSNEQERTNLEIFFQHFMPEQLPIPPRLLEAPGHMFTDKATKFVSLINLASLRELENRWGESLDPLRFRANIYIDGAGPFSELGWVGQRIKLGNVIMKVKQRNGRCAATNVNPETGERDRNVPGKLRADFGHKDLGIYLVVAQDGEIHEGDAVTMASIPAKQYEHDNSDNLHKATLICTACYYLLDPGSLHIDWQHPEDLPEDWRCPDCGSSRDALMTREA